jgi:hypothetical protein
LFLSLALAQYLVSAATKGATMTSTSSHADPSAHGHPLDSLEWVAGTYGFASAREGDEEVTVAVAGSWCEYQIRGIWREEDEVLQLVCQLDCKVPESKRLAVYETLALINAQLWIGHFELWAEDGSLLFRLAQVVDSDAGLSLGHADTLMMAAVSECERFYPVFQFVLWAGKKPAEALEAAMLETMGEA